MFFARLLAALIRQMWAALLLWWLAPRPREKRSDTTHEPDRSTTTVAVVDESATMTTPDLESQRFRRDPVQTILTEDMGMEEDEVSDSFLSQLEQRTQQVKITLANLEADKTRIEEQIGRLQPLIPHYDALLAAERALGDADIQLQDATAETPEQSPEGEITAGEPPQSDGGADSQEDSGYTSWSQ